jgi:hypothetical protein
MPIWTISPRGIAALLIVAITVTACAQQPPNLSKKAEAIKHKVDGLAPHSPITVILVQGGEDFGEFLSNDQDGFTLHDIDRNSDVTLRYAEVRKVKSGYGHASASGRRSHRRGDIIVIALVLGALGGLIAAAATASN